MGDSAEESRPRPTIELLAPHHDRAAFSCGISALDDYIHRYVSQDRKRDLSQCFVLAPHAGRPEIMGYYTLSGYGIEISAMPPNLAKRLPSTILLPATLLGRMAVDERHQGHGYGKTLLLHALRTALRATRQVASSGVIVDALNDELVPFYTTRGFVELHDRPRHLFVPMGRIRAMFPEEAGLPDALDLIERAGAMHALLDSAQVSLRDLPPDEMGGRVSAIIDEIRRQLDALR